MLSVLAGSVGRFLDLPLDPQQNLILTPGTQAGLFASLASLIEEGDRVALIDPDYLFSARILRFLGADIGHVPLLFAPDGPCPDLDALDTEFKRKGARYLVFSHPNNPAGAVFSAQTIARIARLANTYDITVLVDELYSRLLHDGCSFPHLASQPEMFARTVTLLGPSKTESLSGYRLGVVVAPPEIISRVENVLSIMALRAPAYAQHVLLPWLRDDHDWLARRLKEFTALRTLTVESLCRLPWLKLQPQAGTAYVWPDVSALGLPGPEIAAALLCEAGVLVSPGYQFGPSSGGHFRLCYARDEAEWVLALDRMVGVLDGLARRHGVAGAGGLTSAGSRLQADISQAIRRSGPLVFISGQRPKTPAGSRLVEGGNDRFRRGIDVGYRIQATIRRSLIRRALPERALVLIRTISAVRQRTTPSRSIQAT